MCTDICTGRQTVELLTVLFVLQNLYSEVAEKKVIESYFYIINSKKLSKVLYVQTKFLDNN